jgi:tetratricopeptide (TPR) repeat protein
MQEKIRQNSMRIFRANVVLTALVLFSVGAFVDALAQETPVQRLFFDGYELLKKGKLQEAVNKFEQGLKQDAKNARAHFYLGEAYRDLKRNDRAQKHYQAAIEAEPNGEMALQARERLKTLSARMDTAVPKVNLEETLRWLEMYFRSTSEVFEGFDEQNNRLRTSEVKDGKTKQYTYEICTLNLVKPSYNINWQWSDHQPNGYLRINYAGCTGSQRIEGKESSFHNGCGFNFPRPIRVLETREVTVGRLSVDQRSVDDALQQFLTDSSHPVRRFTRAMDALVEARCMTKKSPFE